MSNSNFIPPKSNEDKFSCPHCNVVTQHSWHPLTQYSYGRKSLTSHEISRGKDRFSNMRVSICKYCEEPTLWHNENPVYPIIGYQPPPHPDMPKNIRLIYEEAASISQLSPRASCALMRYAIEELIKGMQYEGKLFDNIGELYKQDKISLTIKKGLDAVRLTGNNALHGNQIVIADPTKVNHIFMLINRIVEELISDPQRVESLLSEFSEGELEAIEKRDTE